MIEIRPYEGISFFIWYNIFLMPSGTIPEIQSWKTVLEQRGDINPAKRRAIEKVTKGCIVRALQSVTCQQATEEEWDRRFETLNTGMTLRQLGDSVGWETAEFIPALEQELDRDISDVLGLIALSVDIESPMGKALSTFEITPARLPPSGIKTAIEGGNEVLLAGLTSSRGKIGMHATHLGVSLYGELVSKSDPGSFIKVDEADKYRVLIFKKRQE